MSGGKAAGFRGNKAALPTRDCHASGLPAVEGFIRQIIGWREFMRGVYWLDMPALGSANHFGHTRAAGQVLVSPDGDELHA